jgi:flagellar biosynthesis anti-sigma factor FlgM
MINSIQSSNMSKVYQSDTNGHLKANKNEMQSNNNLSRVEQLKEAIGNGSYKVDINALAEKMATAIL